MIFVVKPFWDQLIRLPRHEAGENTEVLVEIERTNYSFLDRLPATLRNVSRQGIQFEIHDLLLDDEPVVVGIRDQSSNLDVSFEATVRWKKQTSRSKWFVGCRLTREIRWETYGQLFLNHILKAELPAND